MADIEAALQALGDGEIIGLPTDTVYGIAADPYDEGAVGRLFAVKRRPGIKPIPILAASVEDFEGLAQVTDELRVAAASHWPGALTLIVARAAEAPSWAGDRERESIGVRIPDHPVALELLQAVGPLAVTSANRSGEDPAVDDDEARRLLGDDVAVYVPGSTPARASSTVVDLTGAELRVLRDGPVSWGTA